MDVNAVVVTVLRRPTGTVIPIDIKSFLMSVPPLFTFALKQNMSLLTWGRGHLSTI